MTPLKPLSALLVAIPLLGGCTAGGQAIIDEALARGEQGAKAAKDREALILKAAICAMGVGAKNRVLNQTEKDAVETLCGGAPGLTLQDLDSLSRAMNRLRLPDLGQPLPSP